jgi:hypothetical protein
MKPCRDIDDFLLTLQTFGGNKPQLFNEISLDVNSTYQHINSQQKTLNSAMDNFKTSIFKLETL